MSQTKIVVIPFKKLLIGVVIAAIVIAFVIFAVIRLGSNGSDDSRNTTKPKSSTVNASASSNIETRRDTEAGHPTPYRGGGKLQAFYRSQYLPHQNNA